MSGFRNGRKLYRNRKKGKIGGVCAGIADFFDVDVLIVRIIAFLCLVTTLQVAFIAYGVAYFILDDDPQTLVDDSGKLRSQFSGRYERKSVLTSVHDRFSRMESRLRNIEAYVTSSSFKLRDEIDRL